VSVGNTSELICAQPEKSAATKLVPLAPPPVFTPLLATTNEAESAREAPGGDAEKGGKGQPPSVSAPPPTSLNVAEWVAQTLPRGDRQMEAKTQPPPMFTTPPTLIEEKASLQELLVLQSEGDAEMERKGQPPSVSTALPKAEGAQTPLGGGTQAEAQTRGLPFIPLGGDVEIERKGQSPSVSTPFFTPEVQRPPPVFTPPPTPINEEESAQALPFTPSGGDAEIERKGQPPSVSFRPFTALYKAEDAPTWLRGEVHSEAQAPPPAFTSAPRLFRASRVDAEIERTGQPPSVSTPPTLLSETGGQAAPGGDTPKEAQTQELPFLLSRGAEREGQGQPLSVSTPLPPHLNKAEGTQTSLRGEARMEAQAAPLMLSPTPLNEAGSAQTEAKIPPPSVSTALPAIDDGAEGLRQLLQKLRTSEGGSKIETSTAPSPVLPTLPQTPIDESDGTSVPFDEVVADVCRRLRDEYNTNDVELFPMNNRKVAVVIASEKFEGMSRADRQDNVRQFLADDLRTGRLSGVNCSLKTLSERDSK